jgi:hypothetical protein
MLIRNFAARLWVILQHFLYANRRRNSLSARGLRLRTKSEFWCSHPKRSPQPSLVSKIWGPAESRSTFTHRRPKKAGHPPVISPTIGNGSTPLAEDRTLSGGVIPKLRAFTSGARNLARDRAGAIEILRYAGKTAPLRMMPPLDPNNPNKGDKR